MRRLLSRLAIAAALAPACIALFGSPPASAAFEQVGCFAGTLPGLTESCKPVKEEKFGEEVQLGGVGGMAVNYTGNGGVPVGTVYAATFLASSVDAWIAMYTPKVNPFTSERELEFALAWRVAEDAGPVKRCGPLVGTKCSPRVKGGPGFVDVEVDQETGNVYALNGEIVIAGKAMIVEYPADGETEIIRFGVKAEGGKTTTETPEQIHKSNGPGGLAVNDSGDIYVYDTNGSGSTEYHRLMKFRPKAPGVFTEYEYAGTSEDVGAGFKDDGRRPWSPVSDAADNVYVAPEQKFIEMYDSAAKPGDPPVCSFEYSKGGITASTVDPLGGTPFFFSYKQPKRLFELGPCNPATGKFEGPKGEEIIGEILVSPERDDLYGLAFDPVHKFSPGRPAGILYGGAPSPVSSNGVGEGEKGQSSLGYLFAPAEEAPPQVSAQPVSHVTATSAGLHASVDPKGFQTRYAFQYVTEAEYEANPPEDRFAGATEVPLGGGLVPGTGEAKQVGVTLTGLTPDTAYRYRAVARSFCSEEKAEKEEACEVSGEAGAFRTFALTSGPGSRSYELVSPAQKNGGQVLPADPSISSCGSEAECKPGETYDHFPMQSSPDGNAVVYEGTSFDPETGTPLGNSYIARRNPVSGWQTLNLTPAQLQSEGRGYRAFDQALSAGLFGQTGPALTPQAPPEYKDLYLRETESPFVLAPLISTQPPNRPPTGSGSFEARYAGASSDFSRVFFEANDALTEEVPGTAPAPEDGGEGKFNLYEWERSTAQLRLVNVFPGNASTEAGASMGVASTHAVSKDGSRVFFSDEAGQVYVREGASLTREIPDPGKFLSAATDGSRVLLGNGHLYDLQAEETTDLSEGKGGFAGIAGQSDDLSRIYFIDTEVLTGEEANSEAQKAQAGKPNLYAWSEEGGAHYAATLLAGDNGSNLAHSQTWSPLPSRRTAEASPNGRYLAFLTQASLTGYDNTGLCETDHKGGFVKAPCPEVFLYDSQSAQLLCASCNPADTRPLGLSTLRVIKGGEDLSQPRYLTDSGRLYFDSHDSLTPADSNDGVEDVYELEPNGVGDCEREAGCVSLISAGTGLVDSNFLAIDTTAENVFFTSRDRLVQRDKDELIDLYDAREGAPPPSETETTRPECQGEACQPSPRAPANPMPASAAFRGAGNAKPSITKPRCPKGRHRISRKGKSRCVKPHKHANRNHRGVR